MAIGYDTGRITQGMTVKSMDGERLGKVLSVGPNEFYVEKGLFFTKDYVVSFRDVQSIGDDEVILQAGREALRQLDQSEIPTTASAGGTSTYQSGTYQSEASTGIGSQRDERETQRMRLSEEQLDVQKHQRDVGEVHVSKEVIEETQTVTVPVRKERVRVERTPVTGEARFASGESSFDEDESITVPIREEEIEVRKRPVVTGEVRVAKEAYEEEERVAETVRREEPRISGDADVRNATGYTDRDPDKRS